MPRCGGKKHSLDPALFPETAPLLECGSAQQTLTKVLCGGTRQSRERRTHLQSNHAGLIDACSAGVNCVWRGTRGWLSMGCQGAYHRIGDCIKQLWVRFKEVWVCSKLRIVKKWCISMIEHLNESYLCSRRKQWREAGAVIGKAAAVTFAAHRGHWVSFRWAPWLCFHPHSHESSEQPWLCSPYWDHLVWYWWSVSELTINRKDRGPAGSTARRASLLFSSSDK